MIYYPFVQKFPSWLLMSAKMTLFMLVLPGLFTAERALELPKWNCWKIIGCQVYLKLYHGLDIFIESFLQKQNCSHDNLRGTESKFIVVTGNIWMLQLFINRTRTMTLRAIPQYYCFGSVDAELSLSGNAT